MNCGRNADSDRYEYMCDVLEADPVFGELSCKAMMKASNEGGLGVCDVVWAELFTPRTDIDIGCSV